MLPRFDVVAIIAAYNEADIIEQVVSDLIRQGVHVYVLDDGSTDGTDSVVEPYVGRGVVGIERLPGGDGAGASRFALERILHVKERLAADLDADWIINHDADEFRESPWAGVSLRDAIQRVDALGYNAIDFASFDFWPVHDRFRPGEDVREAFGFYAEPADYDRVQIRCWKKTNTAVDLASSGGHEARFPVRKVFPIRFILRHYPIRGQAHGERKIFRERRNRFLDAERARGWHVQYDGVREGASLIRDAATLTPYDADAIRLALTIDHRGVEELQRDLAGIRAAATALRQEIDDRSRALQDSRLTVEARTQELAQAHAELVRIREELEARRVDAGHLATALDETQRRLDACGSRAVQWQGAAEDHARQLEAIRRSLSWRLTAPARVLLRRLRGW